MASPTPLRIGYVPEHYLSPLHIGLALPDTPLSSSNVQLTPFPSGTGHMITSLRAGEIDIAIGLTEGWTAGLVGKDQIGKAKEVEKGKWDNGYAIVGQLVVNPLRWAIVTGRKRGEINGVSDLEGGKVGVSRMGSGSHIMASVLAQQQSWASSSSDKQLSFIPGGPFGDLRDAVAGTASSAPTADFFMWEEFTTKPYFHATSSNPSPPLKKIGEIFTPWPSWMIVANTATFGTTGLENDERLAKLFETLDAGVKEFKKDHEEVVRRLGTGELGCTYKEQDARDWLEAVEFQEGTRGVKESVISSVVDILKGAGVVGDIETSAAVERVIGIKKA